MPIPDNFPSVLTDIPLRDIWQPFIGQKLIADIQEKNFQLTKEGQNRLINIEQQWQLFSSEYDVFYQENLARQHFFALSQQQRQLQEYLSEQRCLILFEYHEIWRLWQIIKIEPSLTHLLTAAIEQRVNKKIAALLLVSMEKFLLACQRFAELNFHPDLTLNTLTLHNNKPIFLGFIPTSEKEAENDLKHAFNSIFTEILMLPKADIKEILHYLELYANSRKDNKILLNSLQVLLTA
ncbi:hypothetical protein DOJK_00079 [Patescibacteria group bacterium]|nr:hypothetical protein DOJK_00079 [Patescibacteria group bacterium]